MNFSKYIKINKTIFIIGFLILTLIPLSYVFSQETESEGDLILTWEAQNFYPSNYSGKSFVTKGTPILVSASGVINNQIVDLSGAEFTWNVDRSFFKRENGANEIVFESDKNSGDNHFVRVTVVQDNLTFTGSITIPVNKPKSVIENPSVSKTIEEGEEKTLRVTPYFFNVSSINDLSFWWEINNILQENRSRTITIDSSSEDLGGGQNLIRSITGNNNNDLESARSIFQLNYNR